MTFTASSAPGVVSTSGVGVSVSDLWKVYGANPQRELEAVQAGKPPSELNTTVAVRDVSFDVNPGETFVVMGLSGSGKSTLVRCLTRLVEPTSGSVTIGGIDVLGMTKRQLCEARGSDWAMVFQHFGLLPHRRVLQNVAYGLEVRGVPRSKREDRAREMIDLVGLTDVQDRHPHELSGGMKQRVGLARALAVRPKLLLLDEPFSALDPLIRTDLQDQLLRLAQLGDQTSIFITHDLSEALKVGHRIAIMRNGEVVQIGSPEEIVLDPADDYVRRFALEAPRAKVVRAHTIVEEVGRLTETETVQSALQMLSAAGQNVALVTTVGGSPYVVTQSDLLEASLSGTALSDLPRTPSATVSEHEKLESVMEKLALTGRPVLVESSRGRVVGAIENAAAVRALTTGIHDES